MTLLFRKRRRRTAWIFWKVILELTHPSSVSRKNLGKTDWKIVKISWNQYFSRYNPPRHVSCFHELFVMWKNEKFSLTKKFFRQINSLVTYLVKPLLSRNFCQKNAWERLPVISTMCCDSVTVWKNEEFCLTGKIFREINS